MTLDARIAALGGAIWLLLASAPSAVAQRDGIPPVQDTPAAPSSTGVAGEPDSLRVEALAGAGIGTRSVRRPIESGAQRLDTAVFAAADVALRVHVQPEARLSLAMRLRYQTSLGLTVEERPSFALPHTVEVRAERIELSAVPTLRLGSARLAPRLALAVGLNLRAFWPEFRELTTPAYSLFGPQLRAELMLPVTDWLSLRAGPELQWIVVVDETIRRHGVASRGVAYGGAAALRFRLGAALALDLSYRQSTAVMQNTGFGADFEDIERFATARVSGAF